MKLIRATVRASVLPDLREALRGMQVTELAVRDTAGSDSHPAESGTASASVEVSIEIVARDDLLAEVVRRLARLTRVRPADTGRVSVLPLIPPALADDA